MTAKTIEEAIRLCDEDKSSFKVEPTTGFIPIGQTNRTTVESKEPAQVRQASDLPAVLFLGSLDYDSFTQHAAGWSVRYVDADPQTFVEVDFDATSVKPDQRRQ